MLEKMKTERNLIVVHYKDGRLLKGYTLDFSHVKDTFHLTSEQEKDKGKIHEIRTNDLKAIFFVKTLKGNKDYAEKKRFEEVDTSNLRGVKIKVEFSDGEIIRGMSYVYSKQKKGFFIFPVDPQSNNEKIYVLADSMRDVKVGIAAEE